MRAALLSIALMFAILIGVNLPAPLLGLRFEDSEPGQRLWFEPPGYVIPIAWFVLFTLLGVARYLLTRESTSQSQWFIVGLAVLCATYAYYTLGLERLTGVSALWFGLFGNLAVIAASVFVATNVYTVSSSAAWLVVPVALWTSYATAIVIGQMRLKGLL